MAATAGLSGRPARPNRPPCDNSYGLPSHTTRRTRPGRQLTTGYPELKSKRRASWRQRQLVHDMKSTRMRPSALRPCGLALAMQDPYRANPLLGLTMAKHLGLTSQEAQQPSAAQAARVAKERFHEGVPTSPREECLQGGTSRRAVRCVSTCAQADNCQCPMPGMGWDAEGRLCAPRPCHAIPDRQGRPCRSTCRPTGFGNDAALH